MLSDDCALTAGIEQGGRRGRADDGKYLANASERIHLLFQSIPAQSAHRKCRSSRMGTIERELYVVSVDDRVSSRLEVQRTSVQFRNIGDARHAGAGGQGRCVDCKAAGDARGRDEHGYLAGAQRVSLRRNRLGRLKKRAQWKVASGEGCGGLTPSHLATSQCA